MKPLLTALLFFFALALAIGCSSEASPDLTPTATTEAPSQPPPATATTSPAPSGVRAHPAGTRTGIAKLDGVIAAAEKRDTAALVSLVAFYTMPCTRPEGIGAIPCPPGAPLQTPVEVFGWSQCEGSFAKRGDARIATALGEFLTRTEQPFAFEPRVYAVIRGPAFPGGPIPADATVIFVSGHQAMVNTAGLTYFAGPCAADGEELVKVLRQRYGEPQFVLPPPR
jgi:hypothetical protein